MAIQANKDLGLIEVATSDTTLATVGASFERLDVTACVLHNPTGAAVTVTLYESPDLTSASGQQVAAYTVAAGESEQVFEVLGQGYETTNLIATASAAGTYAKVTATTYSEGD